MSVRPHQQLLSIKTGKFQGQVPLSGSKDNVAESGVKLHETATSFFDGSPGNQKYE